MPRHHTNSLSPNTYVPAHVLTADYVSAGNGGYTGPALTIAAFATWAADPEPAHAPDYSAAGMKIYGYLDPDRAYRSVNDFAFKDLTGANTDAIARDCSGNPVTTRRGNGVLTDPRSPLAAAHLASLIADRKERNPAASWDAWFLDDFDDALNIDGAPPCNYSAGAWQQASIDTINSLFMAAPVSPFVVNTLDVSETQLPIVAATAVEGAMYEECYMYPKLGVQGIGSFRNWTTTENYEIALAGLGKNFWCFANMGEDPTSDRGRSDRAYIEASFLLTYDLQSSIIQWAGAKTTSRSQVMPEAQLVAEQPLVQFPITVRDLRIANGIFVREYAACFAAATLIGPCAAIVNPDRNNAYRIPALVQQYSHAMAFTGSDSIDGGRFSFSASVPSTLPPLSGTVLH